jgi:hypothetical protein
MSSPNHFRTSNSIQAVSFDPATEAAFHNGGIESLDVAGDTSISARP